MKKIAVTTIASLMTALPVAGAVAAAPAAETSWSGFYGGLSVGYQDAMVQGDGYTLNYFGLTGTPRPQGVTGGGFFGYNFQVPGQHYLVGWEGSLDLGGHSDSKPANGFGIFPKADVSGTAGMKGRIGYVCEAGFLPWLQAGILAGKTNYALGSTGIPIAGNHGSQIAVGGTVGAGLDYAFRGPLFARVSYNYSYLGGQVFFRDQGKESFAMNEFKFGIGYKF